MDSRTRMEEVPRLQIDEASYNREHSAGVRSSANIITSNVTTTTTVTITNEDDTNHSTPVVALNNPLRLTLSARPTVRWDESTVDNEGMGRKSSKRCCIFHKQRDFGESSTDSSDDENNKNNNNSDDEEAGRNDISKKRNENKKKVPDYQRFHA